MTERRTEILRAMGHVLRLATVFALAGLVVDFGFPVEDAPRRWIRVAQTGVVGLFAIHAALAVAWAPDRIARLRRHWVQSALLVLIVLDLSLALFFERSRVIASVWFVGVQVYLVAQFVLGVAHVQEWLTRHSVRPALLLLGSYLVLCLSGAGLLSLPAARAEGTTAWTFTDAFFTSTSAVCVTGLSVRDVGSELSFRGQFLLLLLIQVGGLGLVTIACGAGLMERGRLGVRELNVVTDALGISAPGRLRRFLAFVFVFTVTCEALGAAVLWIATDDVDLAVHDRLWWSVFHSVSAFCNAGFGLSSLSLIPFADRPTILLTLASLIVIGGLGFGVHMDLLSHRPLSFDMIRWLRWRLSRSVWWPFRHRVFETPVRRQLSLNSRIVLATTLLLVVIGTAAFQATEARHALADRASSLRWLTSLFHSVSARTAGFNSVDVGSLQAPTLLFLTVLMVVGASPLSTGGGVRTTTVAIAALAVRAMTRNREHVEAFGRSIALSVVNACIAITVMYGVALLSVTSALLATQSGCSLEDALFESASALSTVGLSTGLTTELDTTGRWILCGAMIAGRIGPLAVLWSFFTRPAPLRYRYPQEAVIVG